MVASFCAGPARWFSRLGGAGALLLQAMHSPSPNADDGEAVTPPPEFASPDGAQLVTTLAGRTIGPYRVDARIGGGAMASVYRAHHLVSGKAVALKVLLPDADDTVRERFRQEARTVSDLHHPNIVATLAVSEGGKGESTYIVMELVEGENLGDLLDRERTLAPADACAVLEPIARALAFAHSAGIVHRDVKPGNILLRRVLEGEPGSERLTLLGTPVVPLLSDFGIARALDAPDLTSAGRTIGTPAYMSPEQCAGDREIDGRADIYSMGAVLYRCVVGRPPFVGATTQILYAHVYDPVTLPEEVMQTLPPLLVAILRRALAKEPAERYPNASALADDLLACQGGVRADGAPLPREPQTLTLPALPATRPLPSAAGEVLVPGRNHPAAESGPVVAPSAASPSTASPAFIPYLPTSKPAALSAGARPRTRAPRRRWRGLLAALAVTVPLVVLSVLLLRALLADSPQTYGLATAVEAGTTPASGSSVAVATAGVPATVSPVQVAVVTTPTRAEPAAISERATPNPIEPTRTPPAASTAAAALESAAPLTIPTPAGDIAAFWEEARAFYEERDWESALSWLNLVQRMDGNFERGLVQNMLVDVRVALAASAARAGRFEVAAQELHGAVELAPERAALVSLLDQTERAIDVEGRERADALRNLQVAHLSFGSALLRENRVCDASDQYETGAAIAADPQTAAYAADLRKRCEVVMEAHRDQKVLESLQGALVYSSQTSEGDYRIYRVDAQPGAASRLVIDDGREPSVAPDGRRIAFYSTRSDAQGLAGYDLGAGLEPGARSILFTQNPEDARDSPASWNGSGSELVFASRDPQDNRSSIYVVEATGQAAPARLAPGQSPAWGWATDRIAWNGVDSQGQRAGLWQMQPDGSNTLPLTDNGADIRPTWAPDGSLVAFMSNNRSGSWDVWLTGATGDRPVQLTDAAAQDGLPTFSPDGKYIAYASDQGGRWNLWVVPVEGGKPLLLTTVEGALTNWLEHSLQWIP